MIIGMDHEHIRYEDSAIIKVYKSTQYDSDVSQRLSKHKKYSNINWA